MKQYGLFLVKAALVVGLMGLCPAVALAEDTSPVSNAIVELGSTSVDDAPDHTPAAEDPAPDSWTIFLDFSGIDTSAGKGAVDVDGVSYKLTNDTITLDGKNTAAQFVTYYVYNDASEDADTYGVYPTGMYVWTLSFDATLGYTATRVEALDNALKYAGCAVRTTGKNGIRIVTQVPKSVREGLMSGSIAGMTLLEYGTAVQWDDTLGSESLTLDNTTLYSHAYSRDQGEDPIYRDTSDAIRYTGVMVGFSDEQVSKNLSIRPYMKLADEEGNIHILYGGVIHRSIGYIASQNYNAFEMGTVAYRFIWKLIHLQYGNSLDSAYGYVDWVPTEHVPEIYQYPELPWGCESEALTIALEAWGYSLSKTEIYDDYLDFSSWDYVNAYVGSARYQTGLGQTFPPAIVNAANKYLKAHGSSKRAYNLSGTSFDDLMYYVDQGYPVIVWHTIYMYEPHFTGSVLYGYSSYNNEHCIVVYGHDGDGVSVSDSLSGLVWRPLDDFVSLYNRCGYNAVVIA